MKDNNIVQDKSYQFALRIVKLYKILIDKRKEYVLSKQLLRSGTAIGALIKEAEHGQSKEFTSIHNDCKELICLLASIVKTTKQSVKK